MKVDFIITRYNEFINWIEYLPESLNNIYVYNKGYNTFLTKGQNVKNSEKIILMTLDNVGKSDHTIAHHIITHWNELPDVCVFLPGSIMMNPEKGKYLGNIVKNIESIETRHKGFYSPRFKKVSTKYNFSKKEFNEKINRNVNNTEFIPSEWATFKDFKKALIDDRPIHYIAFRGMFIVCKENIKHISPEIYYNILKSTSVGENSENQMYVERIWAHLFRQYSFDNYENNDNNNKITRILTKDEPNDSDNFQNIHNMELD